MKRCLLLLLNLSLLFSGCTEHPHVTTDTQDYLHYVNPIIGTNGMGHTFPGACAPFGIVQLSPDTDTVPHDINGEYQPRVYEYCAGYQHKDSTIVGFSHTHFSGTGHSDLGDILVMPVTGGIKFNPGTQTDPDAGYRSRYSHDTEKASPGYYSVVLDDYGVKVELTATEHVGIHRYTYPEGQNGSILLDLQHGIYNYDGKTLWANLRVENDTLLTGYRITNGWARTNYTYFAVSFNQPIVDYGYRELEKPKYNGMWGKFDVKHHFPEMTGRKIVAYFTFNDPKTLEMKVALSATSTEGALKNLHAETDGQNFDQLLATTQAKWNKELSVLQAEGTEDQKAMLYTSLYHTMINPSIYMDVDGQYRGIDHNIHQADGFTNYTVFSLWDTYRALHPLFNLLQPQRNADMVQSMLKHSEQSVHGLLPVWSHMGNENWCMIGYHATSVLADAYVKETLRHYLPTDGESSGCEQANGKRGNPLVAEILEAMQRSSTCPYYVNLTDYQRLGYVPFERNSGCVSITMEYAYDDWTIYKAALKAGDQKMAEQYRQRASNWRNTFDAKLGFARPRMGDGTWKTPFSLFDTEGEGFVEGNSWVYSFYVPHDVKGLIQAMGGDARFIRNLDTLFVMQLPPEFFENTEDVTEEGLMGCYNHGNEPAHHIAYLYNWSSQPYKTQYWLREIMNRFYRNNIDGLCGNDDCGQMSAWYVFSVMGFYPVCPGSDQYVLGAPYLPYLKVRLGNGQTLEIKAPGVSDDNRYVQKVTLNGKEISKLYLTHDQLLHGGTLEFEMGPEPNRERGLKEEDKPYSMEW